MAHNLCGWKDGTWQAEALMWKFLVWGYYMDNSQVNSYKQRNKHMPSLGMTLVVIVGAYTAFANQQRERKEDWQDKCSNLVLKL